ncbi:glutamine synthetase [Trichoderma barbatum]
MTSKSQMYFWIGAVGETRSKSRVCLNFNPRYLVTELSYSIEFYRRLKKRTTHHFLFRLGILMAQAPSNNTDVYLRPCAVFPDPSAATQLSLFWQNVGMPIRPFGCLVGGFPQPQGPCYCGVGDGKVFTRGVAESHYKACLYVGVKNSGTIAEAMPRQWEFQIGPCEEIEMGDHLWVARLFLIKIAEEFGLKVPWHPKPKMGDSGGMKHIEEVVETLGHYHSQCIEEYGDDNDKRLTSCHETGNIEAFSWRIANRSQSIRIPRETATRGYGCFEDRGPASNADPYRVTKVLMIAVFGRM